MNDETLAAVIAKDGFVILDVSKAANPMIDIVARPDWLSFAGSWDGMPIDTYMADGGRYRRRRYRVYEVSAGEIRTAPHQPHYQSLDFNHLNGGVERWFEPIGDSVAGGPIMTDLIGLCRRAFEQASRSTRKWHVEVHQFRIEAEQGRTGNPTPEGMHRDGTDYVMVLMVKRENVQQGTTTVADEAGTLLGSFTLSRPGDCVLLDDRRVYHGVTPVEAVDPSKPAYRDVLVVTFRDASLTPLRQSSM